MADSSDSEGGCRLGIPQAVPEIGREANVARPKRVSAPAKLFARLPALGYGGHGERPRTFKPKGSWHAVIQHDKPPWLAVSALPRRSPHGRGVCRRAIQVARLEELLVEGGQIRLGGAARQCSSMQLEECIAAAPGAVTEMEPVAVSGSQGIERSGTWRDCSIMRAPVRTDTP